MKCQVHERWCLVRFKRFAKYWSASASNVTIEDSWRRECLFDRIEAALDVDASPSSAKDIKGNFMFFMVVYELFFKFVGNRASNETQTRKENKGVAEIW